MTRDNLAVSQYFDEKIEKEELFIQTYLEEIDDEIASEGVDASGTASAIVSRQIICASMAYSRGDAIEDVQRRVNAAFEDLKYRHELYEKYPDYMRRNERSYNNCFYQLVYSVLYSVNKKQVQRVIYDVEFFDKRDPILLAMLSYLKGEPINQEFDVSDLDYPEDYGELWRAISQTGEARIPPLKRYLEGWYSYNEKLGGNGAPGIGAHKKMIRYQGYWCWEAAAVAVMMDIDDTSFRDHEHYPKDLADWARYQKANK